MCRHDEDVSPAFSELLHNILSLIKKSRYKNKNIYLTPRVGYTVIHYEFVVDLKTLLMLEWDVRVRFLCLLCIVKILPQKEFQQADLDSDKTNCLYK